MPTTWYSVRSDHSVRGYEEDDCIVVEWVNYGQNDEVWSITHVSCKEDQPISRTYRDDVPLFYLPDWFKLAEQLALPKFPVRFVEHTAECPVTFVVAHEAFDKFCEVVLDPMIWQARKYIRVRTDREPIALPPANTS